MQKIASYFITKNNDKVQCVLCPHNCIIDDGNVGICKVRKNISGELIAESYSKISALSVDPIEKKPLYHFFPGKNILSIGSVGCNLACNFCQNSNISQVSVPEYKYLKTVNSDIIVNEAVHTPNNIGLAYTYNEPVIWFEFILETAKKIHDAGLKNVLVSNGFINPKPLKELIPFIDAFNIDLKAFTNDFYKQQTSSALNPVLETIKIIAKSGKHLEITTLVIPTLNDNPNDFERLVKFIANEAGKKVPFHISRYFPSYKSEIPPTDKEKLYEFKNIAEKYLSFVYLGNI